MSRQFTGLILLVAVLSLSVSALAQQSEPKQVVAVFVLQVKGLKLEQSTKTTLTGYLASRLTAGGLYQVAPASSIRQALIKQKKESNKDCYDQFCQIKIGQAIAAHLTLNSLIWRVGKLCSLNLDLYDVRTEAMVNSVEIADLDCAESGLKQGMARGAAKLSGAIVDETPVPSMAAAPASPRKSATPEIAQPPIPAPLPGKPAGTLNITGSPAGALVEIEGPPEFGTGGRGTARLPVSSLMVPPGNYKATVTSKDYDKIERTAWVYAGSVVELSVALEYAFGQIEITGGPAGTKGQITCTGADPMNVALPGEGSAIKLAVRRGDCRVVFAADGLDSIDRIVPVAGGKTVSVDVDLKPNITGIKWVRLPGGTFQRDSNSVTLSAFEIATTEVTVAQYRKCVDARVCSAPGTGNYCNWGKSGRYNDPVNCVDWNQALQYAKWAGGRLPTEAEWEYAARSGGRNQEYPWGDQTPSCSLAVFSDGGDGCGRNSTWPICSKSAGNTAQGLCDMAGNVWEWVSDWYGSYPSGSLTNPTGPSTGSLRVYRGGSWGNIAAVYVRSAYRGVDDPAYRGRYLGFRPARSVRRPFSL